MGTLPALFVGVGVILLVVFLLIAALMMIGALVAVLSSLSSWAMRCMANAPQTRVLVLLANRNADAVFWVTTGVTCLLLMACGTTFLTAFIMAIAGGLGSVVIVRQKAAPLETEDTSDIRG
jgi:hypothetical protein